MKLLAVIIRRPISPDRNKDGLVRKDFEAGTAGRMAITGKDSLNRKVRSSMRRRQSDPGKIRSFHQKTSRRINVSVLMD
ncbi:MAG: hypothetical protein ACREDT_15015 [Methylocella sp.]